MNENDCLPSRVVLPFRGCLYGGELPGCPSYSPCRVEKTLYLYETELPGKHEAYVLKWATSTRQITNLCK